MCLCNALGQINSAIISPNPKDSGYPVGGGGAFSYSEDQTVGGEAPWGVQFSPVRTNGPDTAEGAEDYDFEHDDDEDDDEDEDQRCARTFRPNFLTSNSSSNEQLATNSSQTML